MKWRGASRECTACCSCRPAVVRGAVALVIPALLAVLAEALASPVAVPEVTARITIVHRGVGYPSLVRIRVDPPSAAGRGELLLSIYNTAGVINRHVLEPVAPGAYEAEYVFPAGGIWRYYMRFGLGQAGFTSAGYVRITAKTGSTDSANAVFRSGLRRAPALVQPFGYAAFGLMAVLALAGVSAILIRLARCGPRAWTSV